jgi:hypothetical protein
MISNAILAPGLTSSEKPSSVLLTSENKQLYHLSTVKHSNSLLSERDIFKVVVYGHENSIRKSFTNQAKSIESIGLSDQFSHDLKA